MRRLAFPLILLALAGCATIERPKPLTSEDVVALAKSGRSRAQIIEELKNTDTVLTLQASDFVRLHQAGVPTEVLDHLQRAQIDEIRWRDRYSQNYWSPLYRGFGPCPWGYPSGFMGPPYRGRFWGC